MNTIRTKAELLTFFADNGSGAITEQMLRDFVVSSQVLQTEVIDALGVTVSEFADLVLIAPGGSPFTLPLISGYGDRTMTIANGSGFEAVIQASPGETINGQASITLGDEQFALIGPDPLITDWIVIVRTQAPTKQLYQVMAARNNPNDGDYLYWGGIEKNDAGYCLVFSSMLTALSINRTDSDNATIQVIKNNVVVGEFATSDNQEVYSGLSVSFDVGDELRVRNKSGGNKIDRAVVSMMFEVL